MKTYKCCLLGNEFIIQARGRSHALEIALNTCPDDLSVFPNYDFMAFDKDKKSVFVANNGSCKSKRFYVGEIVQI